MICVDKVQGETPLEALERVRKVAGIDTDVPMTYAGRLDPLASGLLLVLVGDECKAKDDYLGLDKEYCVEVCCGVETDTYDPLGLITSVNVNINADTGSMASWQNLLQKYVGEFEQEYPLYSSKTVDGKQLHEYARQGLVPEIMPKKSVKIYTAECLRVDSLGGDKLAEQIIERVNKVKGDFRQDEIVAEWQKFAKDFGNAKFTVITIKVSCSSGTYMRSLAQRIGKDMGVGALALSIRRTKVGDYVLEK